MESRPADRRPVKIGTETMAAESGRGKRSGEAVETAIEVSGLRKRFGEVTAIAGISFTVGRGELFGFLGPNGAGKTTTINILAGLARPDAGTVRIGGIDCTGSPKAAQHLIGVVPDESNLYPELSGFDNLCFCAALYGLGVTERRLRARELLQRFALSQAARRRFGSYSKGMKRKLTIAAGIIHRPQVLFLDEPTTGIDVASARQIRQLIVDMHRAGTTVFLTTHYIEEAERLCERIAFIVSGGIVRVDTVAALMQPIQDRHAILLVVQRTPSGLGESLAARFPHINFRTGVRGELWAESAQPIQVGPLAAFLGGQGIEVFEARRILPSLEDIFVRVTGIEAEAMKKDKEKAGGAV
jgi:ABC-2 type transport system ATP-binding protein